MAQHKKTKPFEHITIGQLLHKADERWGNNLAINRSGVAWTYHELEYYSDAVSAGLLALGVRKGDHVAIVTELEPESLLMYYAVQKIGAVVVLICTSLPAEETARQVEEADCSYLVLGTAFSQDLLEGYEQQPENAALKQVIYVGPRVNVPYPGLCELMKMGASITAEQLQAAKDAVDPTAMTDILFTSGTTSRPKMVMTNHLARVNNGIQIARFMEITEKDRFMVTTPMFHCFCLSTNLMAACANGACLCIPETRHTGHILQMIHRERCTVFSGVPTMFHAVLCHKDFDSYDLASLRTGIIGGSTYPVELFYEIEDRLGMTLLSSLGQTECAAGLTCAELDDDRQLRADSVGRIMDYMEGAIADTRTGEHLPAGETGEILVRGYEVMMGYYKHPEQTAKAVDKDGWLHTGDLGHMDDNDYVWLNGRLKDLIIRGGENIGPPEIENLISRMPGVNEVKVLGVPDMHYGEEVCACISRMEGASEPTEEDVRKLIGDNLASFKVPKYVFFFDELPHSATGKMSPNAVRSQALARMGLKG